jgi:hypothetical protein
VSLSGMLDLEEQNKIKKKGLPQAVTCENPCSGRADRI